MRYYCIPTVLYNPRTNYLLPCLHTLSYYTTARSHAMDVSHIKRWLINSQKRINAYLNLRDHLLLSSVNPDPLNQSTTICPDTCKNFDRSPAIVRTGFLCYWDIGELFSLEEEDQSIMYWFLMTGSRLAWLQPAGPGSSYL